MKSKIFRLVNVIRGSGNRILEYEIRSEHGSVKDSRRVQRDVLKQQIVNGEITVYGLKLDSLGRLIEDKSSRIAHFDMKDVDKDNREAYKDIINNTVKVFTGNLLEGIIESVAKRNFKQRDCVKRITKYCLDKIPGKLMMIHGVRRTGKTTCMVHTIMNLMRLGVDKSNIAYILVSGEVTYEELFYAVADTKAKYIFIDEITNVVDLVNKANTLVDVLGSKTIVITGTESFALQLASDKALLMRTIKIRTNLMSIQEYVRLYEEKRPRNNKEKRMVVTKFIENSGSTVANVFKAVASVKDEVNVALIENMRNTIRRNNGTEFSEIDSLSDSQIEYIIYTYIASAMQIKSYEDLRNMEIKVDKKIINLIENLYEEVDLLRLREDVDGIKLKQKNIIARALVKMDIISMIDNSYKADSDNEMPYREYCCNMSGLYNGIMVAINNSENDVYTSKIRRVAEEKPTDSYWGYVVENVVKQQCVIQLKTWYNIRYLRMKNESGTDIEVDLVLTKRIRRLSNIENRKVNLIEIKSSDGIKKEHRKNFMDESLLEIYGYDANKIIVYFGETKRIKYDANGVEQKLQYVNIYDFLMDIKKWIE